MWHLRKLCAQLGSKKSAHRRRVIGRFACVSPYRQTRTELLESTLRPLSVDETLRVRKILACATRMKGRFGKTVLAATLRGSAAKNVMQAHLNELSTYGLLKDMRQDDILIYIDASGPARCLRVSPGEYPTVSITELGERVMREQEQHRAEAPGHYFRRHRGYVECVLISLDQQT